MINRDINYVEDFTLSDAWRDAIWLCVLKGQDYVVKGKTGSYIGQIRKQLSNIMIRIVSPNIRPLAPYTPPPYPPPTNDDKIEKYFLDYIMSSNKHGKEDYTYGEYISKQIPRVIELLIESKGNTNQACISVGNEQSIFLKDPPCLRTVSFKIINGKLNMSIFFRSNDLYAGFPENLGGLQLLKEYILSQIEDFIDVIDGEIFYYGDGLHIYEQYFELVNALNINKIKVSEKILIDKQEFNSNMENETK